MASTIKRATDAVVGIILLAVAGGVLATQNAETMGGTLPYLVATFIPVGLGVRFLSDAFGQSS